MKGSYGSGDKQYIYFSCTNQTCGDELHLLLTRQQHVWCSAKSKWIGDFHLKHHHQRWDHYFKPLNIYEKNQNIFGPVWAVAAKCATTGLLCIVDYRLDVASLTSMSRRCVFACVCVCILCLVQNTRKFVVPLVFWHTLWKQNKMNRNQWIMVSKFSRKQSHFEMDPLWKKNAWIQYHGKDQIKWNKIQRYRMK